MSLIGLIADFVLYEKRKEKFMEQQNQLNEQIFENPEPDNISDNSVSQTEAQQETSKADEGQSNDQIGRAHV